MSEDVLYHFFPRKAKSIGSTLRILKSIFNNGLYLTKEKVKLPWKDLYGKNKNRELTIEQNRFCLTAISNNEELLSHSKKFGYIGLEFSADFITKLGGFPVFYVPSPQLESADIEDYKGISLLYRIAEVQELLEYIVDNKKLASPDIDIENALGAIRFLANVCYPTKKKIGTNQIESNYYSQREWRIIYGLTSDKAVINKMIINNEDVYAIESYNNLPVFTFINKIVLNNAYNETNILKESIRSILFNYGHNIKIVDIK